MKNLYLCLCLCIALSSCDQFQKTPQTTGTVTYSQLTAQKNYWDSIPGRVKVRERARPYRYYLNDNPYTGKVEDYFAPGRPKLIGTFKDGFAEGLWKYYQENDSLEQTGSFENGYVTGEWRFYDRKGKEDTRLFYKRTGRDVSADTLMVVYQDGSRQEWQKDKIIGYYPTGNRIKYELSPDGSSGTFRDPNGHVTDEMKDFIKHNNRTDESIFYIDRGKHKKAFEALLAYHHTNWTKDQKAMFANANRVAILPEFPFALFNGGFQVTVDSKIMK